MRNAYFRVIPKLLKCLFYFNKKTDPAGNRIGFKKLRHNLVLSFFNNRCEGFRIMDGKIGEDLAVDLNIFL